MHIINARNVNDALSLGLGYLMGYGTHESSRNGDVIVAPGPVATVYERPTERVLFSPARDANPFFHLMEALWMLAGRNDLAFPQTFVKTFERYSDDGITLSGAYGYRWRSWFDCDQLPIIVSELVKNPESRRAVLTMWDSTDLGKNSKDIPCNTHIYFDLRGKRLNMTVCNRSNDAIWGAYGANAVHMSFLQEIMAAMLTVPVGVYRQFSNNFHIYTDVFSADKIEDLIEEGGSCDLYRETTRPLPLVQSGETTTQWFHDLDVFFAMYEDEYGAAEKYTRAMATTFFREVALPMWFAWKSRKEDPMLARTLANTIRAEDWRVACINWLNRRKGTPNA